MSSQTPKRVHFNNKTNEINNKRLTTPVISNHKTQCRSELSPIVSIKDPIHPQTERIDQEDDQDLIKVGIRVRPVSTKEKDLNGNFNAIRVNDSQTEISLLQKNVGSSVGGASFNKQNKFTCDFVITDQEEINLNTDCQQNTRYDNQQR
jgi:hypothetical protein